MDRLIRFVLENWMSGGSNKPPAADRTKIGRDSSTIAEHRYREDVSLLERALPGPMSNWREKRVIQPRFQLGNGRLDPQSPATLFLFIVTVCEGPSSCRAPLLAQRPLTTPLKRG